MRHRSAIRDFTDKAEVDAVYIPEVVEFLKEHTGADRPPDHEWWYFRDMTPDEVPFFVFNDSDDERAWRVAHTAFRDPTVEASVPRHSIEVRTFAFFH